MKYQISELQTKHQFGVVGAAVCGFSPFITMAGLQQIVVTNFATYI